MGTLTIRFVGLCTQIQDTDATGQLHRCVLVNAIVPRQFGKVTVPTHQPLLRIRQDDIAGQPVGIRLPDPGPGDVVSWPLNGATFTVRGARPYHPDQPVFYSANYRRCMPSLTALNKDNPIARPAARVVRDRQVPLASCYFDVNAGSFDVGSTPPNDDFGSLFAVLTIETDQDDPVLDVSSFTWGTGSITLRSGATITILNIGVEESDRDTDFLTHYAVLESVPENAGFPASICGDLPGFRPSEDPPGIPNIGPGCSNSNYP